MTVGIGFLGFKKGSSGKGGLVEVVKHVNSHFPIDTSYIHSHRASVYIKLQRNR